VKKSCPTKSDAFHEDGPSFFFSKAAFENWQLFGFLNRRIPGTHASRKKSDEAN
jgi:hypothetical protein